MAMGNNARVLHSCFHPHSQRQDCQHIAAKQPWESWDGVVGVGPQRGGGGRFTWVVSQSCKCPQHILNALWSELAQLVHQLSLQNLEQHGSRMMVQ